MRTQSLNTDPMQIRIHNRTVKLFFSVEFLDSKIKLKINSFYRISYLLAMKILRSTDPMLIRIDNYVLKLYKMFFYTLCKEASMGKISKVNKN
jgi:hypothetical protein